MLSERISEIRRCFPDAYVEGPLTTLIHEEDWAQAWKRHYRAIEVGRILIKPSWLPAPEVQGDGIVVELDQQMAFGTGAHASTQLALLALQRMVRRGHQVADVGTGTGILAIAAALMGAASVWAVDNDPLAVRVARANCKRNAVADKVQVVSGDLLNGAPAGLDGIVANISPHADIAVAEQAPRRLRAGGYLILSGFTNKSEQEVASALTRAGLSQLQRLCDDEWVCLIAISPQ